MKKIAIYRLILTVLSFLSIALHGIAHAIDFNARDTRVDLPVLTRPNNAITPRMSADQNGHVYVVWSDNRGGSPSIYANTFFADSGWQPSSTPIPTGFPRPSSEITPGDATTPDVCADNSGHVYVVWVDDRAVKAGTGKRDIYFRYSKDYGLSWYPAFIEERIDSDNPSVGDSVNPKIACDDNGNVYIVWQDDRNRAGIYEVYFRSLQVQFNKPTDFIVYYQTPELRLNTGVSAGIFRAINPVIFTDKGGYVYVVWQDNRNIPEEEVYPGIYFNVSKNHGVKWETDALRIDRAPVGGNIQFSPPVISSDVQGHIYVAWMDNAGRAARGEQFAGDGTSDVYFNRSSNYGTTWDDEDKRIDTTGGDRIETRDVAIANNNKGIIGIVWASNLEATTKGVSTNYNIYFNHSEDFGRTFPDSESNIRIDTGVPPGETNAFSPAAQVDNLGDIFVTWLDKRPQDSNIYFNFSIEKGRENTWQENDIRLDYLTPPGDSINPVMSIDNIGHVYVVWQDTKSSLAKDNYNIYFISGFLDIGSLLIAGQRLGEACFIATAAYGSPLERHVELLREFRDRYLLTNKMGRWFVSTYYRLSPPAAWFLLEHSYLRAVVRVALLPAVWIAMVSLHTTPLQKIVLILPILLIIGTAIFTIVRQKRSL